MKITAIQQALQTLGFLPPSHQLGGDWDALTNAGYIQAAQADNLHLSLHCQPSHPDQLPSQVRALIDGEESAAPATPPSPPVQTGPTAEELAAAAAAAAKEEADRAEAQQKANAQAAAEAATAAKLDNIDADVKQGDTLESDADVNTPDSEQDGE